MELSEPTTLVKLPHPGLIQGGRTRFAQVYGTTAGVKRKRPEICACVDGNSVNIYEAASGRNVSSFAVPPDTRFLCNPSSTRIRSSPKESSRLTCCVTERRNRVSVNRYLETVSSGQTTTSVAECALQDRGRKYCCLEVLGTEEALVLAEDGHGVLVSFSKTPSTDPFRLSTTCKSPTFLDARVVGNRDATSSVLKSRPDLASRVSEASHTIVAVFTYTDSQSQGQHRVRLGVWPLDATSASSTLKIQQPVLEYDVPEVFAADSHLTVALDDTTSTITVNSGALSMAYDITAIQPRRLYRLSSDAMTDVIQISRHLQVRAKASSFELVNTAYDSLLSIRSGAKRKRGGASLAIQAFIAYISQQKRILAYSASSQTILAVDVASSNSSSGQVSSLLANLGRGSAERPKSSEKPAADCSIGLVVGAADSPNDWSREQEEQLTKLVTAKDGTGFEAAFIDQVMQNDVEGTRSLPEAVLDFLLMALFGFDNEMTEIDWTQPGYCPLHIRLTCPRLLKWCAASGQLANTRLYAAQKRTSMSSPLWFPQSAIGTALIKADPSMYLPYLYLEFAAHLDPESLGTLLRQLLRALIHNLEEVAQPHLLNGPTSPSQSKALTKAVPEKNSADSPVSHCLVLLLQRLSSTGQENASRQISKMLNPAEIQTLIQFLRQQLFQGGHTRSLDANIRLPLHDEMGSEWWMTGAKLPLSASVTLLNGCIDAIGPAGFFGAMGEEEFVQTLLSDLNSEVSLACQAVEEATFLNGITREALRYAESVERRHEDEGEQESKRVKGERRGEIITVYAEPVQGESSHIPKSSLPLSLQAGVEIDPVKGRKGGGQSRKRSGRETAMLRDREQAGYTLERLVL